MSAVLLLVAVLTVPHPFAMQPATDSIKKDTPFKVGCTHDGIDTDVYTLYLNTSPAQQLPRSSLLNGEIQFPFPSGLPKGTYAIECEASNAFGSTKSGVLTLTVTAGNPSAPGQPRIIRGGGE